jgi:hypothetical protein
MKKTLMSAACVVAFVFAAQAQEVKFGVKAGVNFSSLTGDVEDVSASTGLHVGGLVELKLTDKFSIQPEVLYSMQGAEESETYSETVFGTTVTYKEEAKIKLGYINVPIVAKYYVTEGLSLELGPQIGFLVNAESEYTSSASGGGMSESESETIDIKDSTKSVDFGLVGGVAYDLPMGLFFQGRYNLGLSDITDEDGEDNDNDDFSIQNSVISLSVGFKF